MLSKILKNEDARISFAVIGVFLILISVFISAFLLKMDYYSAASVAETAKLGEADEAYLYAKADIPRALNYAALRALKQAGKTPLVNIVDHPPDKRANGSLFHGYEVNIKRESYLPGEMMEIEVNKPASAMVINVKLLLIDGNNTTVNSWNMSELSWGWLGSDVRTLYHPLPRDANSTWTAKIEGEDVQDTAFIGVILDQEGWIREMTHHNFKGFLKANYANESYTRGEYSVNVYPTENWRETKLSRIEMKLERKLNAPDILTLKPEEKYEVYYEVTVPVTLTVLQHNEIIHTENTSVTTLVTSRYLLLKELGEEYEKRISGTKPLMIESTSAAMAYTWARGYLQFVKREPANIVNNTHLGLIVNAATLLDQGFVFNSVDPMSIVELVYHGHKSISRKEALNNTTLEDGKYKHDPEGEAHESAGNDSKEAEEENGRINLNASTIAEAVYAMAEEKIDEIAYFVYSASISLDIQRETTYNIPAPGIPYNSEETTAWTVKSKELLETIPYSHPVLGGEKWKVTFQRTHTYKYYKEECETINHEDGTSETRCIIRLKQKQTLIDTREDIVTIKFNCNYHARYDTSNDAAYAHFATTFEGHDDTNLNDVLEEYKKTINWEATLEQILQDKDSSNHETLATGKIEPWVKEEAKKALLEIKDKISNEITTTLDHRETPLPEDALQKAKSEMLAKFDLNAAEYKDRLRYFDLLTGEYKSAGAKVIYKAREWYVDEVRKQLADVMDEAITKVKKEQDDGFKNQSLSDSEIIDLKSIVRSAAALLKEKLWFPLGLEMNATREGTGNDRWNESVVIGIDQTPNYLNPYEKYKPLFASDSEAFYPLAVQNIAFFGTVPKYTEKGLPILPPKYWIMTTNAWYIHVKGEYYEFKVIDANNEPHPHPVWGHEAQEWVRIKEPYVWDPVSEKYIGNNTRLKFEFKTGTFIFVPPGPQGVGDSMVWFDNERSPRAIEEGW